jgi:hypothetical protein
MEKISYADAKARGLKRFFTGEPCKKRGHIAERLTSNPRMCVECKRVYRVREQAAPKSKPIAAAPASDGRAAPKSKPIAAAPVAKAAPPAYERTVFHRDPGQWCDPRKIDAAIERIFNGAPRLGVATLAASEAA